ncbi:MAG: 30S ribosomal protein S9 [Chloroflexi bacterium]|nr:30S ribosomal protein S9 [Chloroflexota bacterium]MCZ6789498.1 30S ribosomal protein S9 [Chloroflexota bacterium]MCZ6891640.1 30S ribosomal protein S9 [Chloroflexota bacterium]
MTQAQHYYYGTGKRKTSIAKVRLYTEPGNVVVNGKPLEEAFPWKGWQVIVNLPLEVTETLGKYSVSAQVYGGGFSSQAGAVRHGISRALAVLDENLKPLLRKHGLLTRDARIKESKKYGLKRARKAEQYSKR